MRLRNEFFRVLLLILQITLTGFGGGNALLPTIHHYFVTKHRWIDEKEFQQIVITSNSLPGPNVIQVLGYIATKRLGLFLGIIVTFIGVLPNVLLAISIYYLLQYLPQQYLLIVNVAVIGSIVGILIGFIIKYIQNTEINGIRLVYILAISLFTFAFCFFVPSPFNIPAIVILIAFVTLFLVSYYQKRKQLRTSNGLRKKRD